MHAATLTLVSSLLLGAGLVAQNYVVAPTILENLEGNSNNTWPWNNAARYMQLHGDLKGTPRGFTGIAWRRDGALGNTLAYAPRTLTMEVSMGDGNLAAVSATFATNYLNTPVNVFTRKTVNAPDWVARRASEPATFDFALVFDAPYGYIGTNDLVYEIVIHATTAGTAGYAADYVNSNATANWYGAYQAAGTGCTTANGAMGLRSQVYASPSRQLFSLRWDIERGPTSAQTTCLVGLADPNLPVPGLCTNLRTDGALFTVSATTNATGTANSAALTTPYSSSLAGFVFTSQAFALDAGQSGIPVAGSNGITITLPAIPATPPGIARIAAQGNAAASSGTIYAGTGLVTRLRY
ncbi:MAG: hypothetical protein IT458_05305 [Planctomycetes bacterium]|nr:hypothetical protein [Planctomycetota bacterium]